MRERFAQSQRERCALCRVWKRWTLMENRSVVSGRPSNDRRLPDAGKAGDVHDLRMPAVQQAPESAEFP